MIAQLGASMDGRVGLKGGGARPGLALSSGAEADLRIIIKTRAPGKAPAT
jgi:hypothetical protein